MSDLLTVAWSEIKKLLEQGLSIVPARNKDDDTGKAKTPYKQWKKYQTQQITQQELYAQLDEYNTTAVAIICGKISGNLEVIDIDTKYKAGIDASVFTAIKEIYPDLWTKLRIHKTPSGGYHILYKVIGEDVPGNKKLATREATSEELAVKQTKKYSFIETRGEGGYVLAPPAMGYAVFQNNPIPIITYEQRCSLINICTSFNELIDLPKPDTGTKYEDRYYDENPFQDYNKNVDFVQMIEMFGWRFVKQRGDFLWFTKPDGRKNDVHAAFILSRRLFYVHSTSTDLEANKCYFPATVLSLLAHGGDKKQTKKQLVEWGFGKIKPEKEAELIKKGEALPPNASEQAKQAEEQRQEQQQQQYPYGIFWEFDGEDVKIIRERLYMVAEGRGWVLFDELLFQIVGKFIYRRTPREFFDDMKSYIQEQDGDLYIDICSAYESFIQRSGDFTIKRLPILDDSKVLRDTRAVCNKFFKNCWLQITAQATDVFQYDELNYLVFADRVQKRDYKYAPTGVYLEYLKLALVEGINENVRNVIGFLAHEYKDETMAYIIVLVEEVADPKMGGGSGKNIFSAILSHTTTYLNRPGAGVKFDEKFFQAWDGEKVFSISDVDKHFNFSFLKEPSSGNMIWKRLWKNEQSVGIERSPKFIVSTNFSFENVDGGLKRRIIPVEFTNFFTEAGGVDTYFKKHFVKDWTEEDWNGYDTFISQCVQSWLRSNRKLKSMELSATGWEKQFIQAHSQTVYDILKAFFPKWVDMGFVTNEEFKRDLQNYYSENDILPRWQPTIRNINMALMEWSAKLRIEFTTDATQRIMGTPVKGRKFGRSAVNEALDILGVGAGDDGEPPF